MENKIAVIVACFGGVCAGITAGYTVALWRVKKQIEEFLKELDKEKL